jgi:hypothetical protein
MFSTAVFKEERGIARLAGAGFASLIALAMVLVLASGASANPIASGSTALAVDKRPAKKLKKNKIVVQRVKPAKVQKGSFVFPVTGGKLNPSDPSTGVIRHSGGLKFKKGKRKLVAKKFVIKVANGVVVAKVGGNNVRLLSVDLSKAKISRNGFGITVKRVGLSLTGAAAKALNKTLKTKAFKKGLRLGHAVVKTQPSSVGLAAEGSTDLTPDAGTVGVLVGAGVFPAPIAPATVTPGGDFSFPITGGRNDVSTFAGEIRHSGGISLTQGGTVLNLTDFTINVDGDPDLTAVVNGGDRVSILDLDLSGLTVNVDPLDITLGNAVGNISADAAAALSATFGLPDVTGAPLGVAQVNAVAK